jgi:hypothetical protein
VLQLWKKGSHDKGLPNVEKTAIPTTVPSRWGYLRRIGGNRSRSGASRARAVGKWAPSEASLGDGNLREKQVAQGIGTTEEKPSETSELPYIVSSTGKYGREEKMMIRIKIRGNNNIEHNTTALIDCEASENFIDKAYAAANEIPT